MADVKAAARRAARRYGVPENLFLAMLKQESGLNPNVGRSSAGAQDIAQFMPATARAYGVTLGDGRISDDLDGAARYLRDAFKRGGSWQAALSIYNSGRPDAYKDPGFAGGQTYNYVKNIMRMRSEFGGPGKSSAGGGGSGLGWVEGKWTTKPGVDNSGLRQQFLQQYVLGQLGDPLQLAAALSSAQDTPATRTYHPGRLTEGPGGASKGLGGGKAPGHLNELFYDPQGGWKNGQSIGAIGGHSDHVHIASTDPRTMLRLGKLAQRMGLRVGENPAFGDKVDPVHAQGSYHYQTKNFHGRKVGEAEDVSGDPQRMAAFARRVRKLYGLK